MIYYLKQRKGGFEMVLDDIGECHWEMDEFSSPVLDQPPSISLYSHGMLPIGPISMTLNRKRFLRQVAPYFDRRKNSRAA